MTTDHMDSSGQIVPTKERAVAATTLAILCVLLLLAGVIAFQQLGEIAGFGSLLDHLIGGIPLPKPKSFSAFAARLGMLDAALVVLSALVSLGYLFMRPRWAWASAVVLWLVSIGLSGILALMCWIQFFIRNPPRGDFAGLAGAGLFIIGVLIPILVGLIASLALFCLIRVRPQRRQSKLSRQPKPLD